MHKKPLIAILALALGWMTITSVAFAAGGPAFRGEGAVPLVKSPLHRTTSASAINPADLSKTKLPSDPIQHIQAGDARTVPGSFCTGDWMDVPYFVWGLPIVNGDLVFMFQDPANTYPNAFGVCAPPTYTFDVTAVTTIVYLVGAGPNTVLLRPIVYSADLSDPGCPEPLAPMHVGPTWSVTLSGQGAKLISLPFAVEACVTGPYFAGYEIISNTGSGSVRIVTDQGQDTFFGDPPNALPGIEARSYMVANAFGLYEDFVDPAFNPVPTPGLCPNFSGFGIYNNQLWSEGYTPDDPATHCNPGSCAWEDYYTGSENDSAGASAFGYFLPSASATTGRDHIGTVITAVGLDTLKACSVFVAFANLGPMSDMLLEILALDGAVTGCGPHPTYAKTVLYSQVIPGAILNDFDFTYVPLTTPFVFGTLNGGAPQQVVVSLRSLQTADQMLGYTTPTDNTNCLLGHTMLRFQAGLNQWFKGGEPGAPAFWAGRVHHEQLIRFEMCREVLPAVEADCGAGGPDEWTSYAHDNRQSGASSINVGDPQEVTLSWTRALPRVSNFTNPTVANDIVYISSDLELNAYDLASGAPVGTLAGTPEMGSSNRGNATVAFTRGVAGGDRDVVFATGGNFNAITALETNLETSPKIWSNNTVTMPPLGLNQQIRFNTSKVVDVAGTDVLYVCTEPASGTGLIYAFNAATGALYPGWLTNPVVLDAAAKHGPAVDGGKLYVGTAIGGSNVDGSIYQIDAATGTIDWNFLGTNSGTEGFPGGVSVEGDFIYALSADGDNLGVRYKIDKSGLAPSVVWSALQGRGLYGTPTIGREFVYFPLDNPNFGILQVDKEIGTVARNFAASDLCGATVFMVPQHLTLSCDSYLFAGDRNARWWLFNAETGDAEWYREWPVFNGGEIVSGTALVSHSGGTDYAVVAVRQLGGTVGQVAAYELNAGPRPRLIQCVHDETVVVPLGSGPGNPHSVADVFSNVGTTALNFTALNITDPLPDGLASAARNVRQYQARVNSAIRDFDGYSSIATSSNLTKKHRMAGLSADMVDGEFSTTQVELMNASNQYLDSRSDARSMAAGAAAIRTSAVLVGGAAVPTSIAPDGIAGLDWIYDGTGLGRGLDANDLEFDMDDPDFNYDGSPVATFHILYLGGCLSDSDTLYFSNDGTYEAVYNDGAMANTGGSADLTGDFNFAADSDTPDNDLYDMGLFVIGDSTGGGLTPDFGAEVCINLYSQVDNYVPNVAPVSGQCGFDVLRNIVLGAKRTGGCPGTPVDIFGEMVTHSMSDTDFAATAGSPAAAIGVDIVQTEVGAYDPLYGDFKLIQWQVINRDAVAKGPIYLGVQADWDLSNGAPNQGLISDNFNGFAIWNPATPTIAYGSLDPNQPHTYSGVDPSFNSPKKLWTINNPTFVYSNTWDWGDETKKQAIWSEIVNGPARIAYAGPAIDMSGQITHKAVNLGPNGSGTVHHAVFGVDATSNLAASIDANATALAKRAARWAGFARGDVNDDGIVDLADVCWLQGGNPIYPAAYSGDVDADGDNDAADVTRLLSYVSGNAGDQPAGAWRF